MTFATNLWEKAKTFLPIEGFFFDRPLVLLQSDDWGRVGLRDREGFDQLTATGLQLGQHPYDFYTLETADDLSAVIRLLKGHRDSAGRPACIGMNFLTANLDLSRMRGGNRIELRPLADGLPDGWERPGLFEVYREGMQAGVFYSALHGATHFSEAAVARHVSDQGTRSTLLHQLWDVGTPYIYWRMPWIGYEYWDPEQTGNNHFLSLEQQEKKIGAAVGFFAKCFSAVPRSACPPGYRGNHDTFRVYAQYGIRVVQNGAGLLAPPHFDRYGGLHIYRSVELEPAVEESFSLDAAVEAATKCIQRKLPVIVSIHSINFHSTLQDFRTATLQVLDKFLTVLERQYPNLLYVHDEDLWQLVQTGSYDTDSHVVSVGVTKRKLSGKSTTGLAR